MVELRCRSEVTTAMVKCSVAEDRIGVFCTKWNHGPSGDVACSADWVPLTVDDRLTTIESSIFRT